MRIIQAERQIKKINWNLSPQQYRLEPDVDDPNAVKVDVIFEHDPETPANVKVKQILRRSNQEDLLPQLDRFDLPGLEREISEKIALQDVDFNDPFWNSFNSPMPGDDRDVGPGFEESYSLGRF